MHCLFLAAPPSSRNPNTGVDRSGVQVPEWTVKLQVKRMKGNALGKEGVISGQLSGVRSVMTSGRLCWTRALSRQS